MRVRHLLPTAVLLVAAVLVVGACGTPGGGPAPDATSAGDSLGTPGAAGSTVGDASPSATGGSPTATAVAHAVPQLEALLPARVGSVTLRKLSQTGDTILGNEPFSSGMKQFLASVGKTPGDLRYAQAAEASGLGLEIGAFQVPGIDGKRLEAALIESSKPGAPGLTTSDVRFGDKRLTAMRYLNGSTVFYYPRGESVFYIGTESEEQVAQVLSLLP